MRARGLLAWNVRRLRVQLGLSQERLADESGTDTAYVSNVEREKIDLRLDTLDKLAAALGVAVGELFAEPEGEAPKPLKQGRKKAG